MSNNIKKLEKEIEQIEFEISSRKTFCTGYRLTHEKLVEIQVDTEDECYSDFIFSYEPEVKGKDLDFSTMKKSVESVLEIVHGRTFPTEIEGWLSADGNVFYFDGELYYQLSSD